jgi:hypothetical protein
LSILLCIQKFYPIRYSLTIWNSSLQVVHPAVVAALSAVHLAAAPAAHSVSKEVLHASAQSEHKLKLQAELEHAEHMHAMASAAASKVPTPREFVASSVTSPITSNNPHPCAQAFDLALSIHTQAGKCYIYGRFESIYVTLYIRKNDL